MEGKSEPTSERATQATQGAAGERGVVVESKGRVSDGAHDRISSHRAVNIKTTDLIDAIAHESHRFALSVVRCANHANWVTSCLRSAPSIVIKQLRFILKSDGDSLLIV